MKFSTPLYLLLGLLIIGMASCSSDPQSTLEDVPVNPSLDSGKEKETEKVVVDSTPIAKTWTQIDERDLIKGQFIIVEGYIGDVPKTFTTYGDATKSSFRLIPRRNSTQTMALNVLLSRGLEPNQIHPLKDGFKREDYKIVTDNGQFASAGSHVRIVAEYGKGLDFGNSLGVSLVSVELLENQLDNSIFESAVELTSEALDQDDTLYSYIDVSTNIDFLRVTKGSDIAFLPVESASIPSIKQLLVKYGNFPGKVRLNKSDKYVIIDANGKEITGKQKLRIYGVGMKRKIKSSPIQFTPESFKRI